MSEGRQPTARREVGRAATVPAPSAEPGPTWLRGVMVAGCGLDPGPLTGEQRFDAFGIHDVERLLLVSLVEDALGIEFPPDLVPAMDTVGDLLYYVDVKLAQQGVVAEVAG